MSGTRSGTLVAHSRAKPCPVCETGSKGCSTRDDGQQFCRGEPVDPARWKRLTTRGPDAAGFHHYRDVNDDRQKGNGKYPGVKPDRPPTDWRAEAERFAKNLTADRRAELAALLGLPVWVIDAIPLVGFIPNHRPDGKAMVPTWTFPELDARERVVGINRRFREPVSIGGGDPTNKAMLGGSGRGLTIPAGWRERPGPVFVVEGASDVLALTAAGLAAVGRFSNTGGAEYLAELLADLPPGRQVVVLAENDQKPDGTWPGRIGAEKVAGAVGGKLARVVNVVLPPDGLKDARKWVHDLAAGFAEVEDWPGIGRAIADHCRQQAAGSERYRFIDSKEFLFADYRETFLVKRVMVKGKPGIIVGPPKAVKTGQSVDLCISLAAGVPFLGTFEVPRPVRTAIVSGESGKATLQETARRIIRAKGLEPAAVFGQLQWCFDLPRFTDAASVVEFAERLKRLEAEVVVIDPVYLCVGGEVDHANMFAMGEAYKDLADRLLKVGTTPTLVHHANRQLKTGSPMELYHIAYSGLDQFARQWMLLNRRTPYMGDGVHDLILSIGGGDGFGGLWDVHIREGVADDNLRGRFWDVSVQTPDAAHTDRAGRMEAEREEKARRKMAAEDAKVLDALDSTVSGGAVGATKNKLLPKCPGLSATKLNLILSRLVEDGILEPVEFEQTVGRGTKQTASGFRRPTRPGDGRR